MTTHELAGLLEHLRDGLGAALQKRTGEEFAEAADALRTLPEKSLKELAKDLQRTTTPAEAGPGQELFLERIRAYRAGSGETIDRLIKDVAKLKQPELQTLIRALGENPGKNKVAENKSLLRRLLETPATNAGPGTVPAAADSVEQQIEDGYRRMKALQDAPALSIQDLRTRFVPLRQFPKYVLDGIARRFGYEFSGGRDEVADELLQTLERMRISQLRGDIIRGSA